MNSASKDITWDQARPGMLVVAVERDMVFASSDVRVDVALARVEPGDPMLVLGECFCADTPGDSELWVHVKVLVKGVVGYMYYRRENVLGRLL